MNDLLSRIELRDATRDDLPAIVEIYNTSIAGRAANADLQPVTVADREAWFEAHTADKHPLWTALLEGEVIGWIALSPFLPRDAYHITAELSVYVAPAWQGQGVGGWMLDRVLTECPRLGIEKVVSLIFAHNPVSLQVHQRQGFTKWGHLPAVTELDGVRRDVVILGRDVSPKRGPNR